MAKKSKSVAAKASAKRSVGAKKASKKPLRAAKPVRAAPGELLTLLDLVRYAVSRFSEAQIVFAHGTTDPVAEAVFLGM